MAIHVPPHQSSEMAMMLLSQVTTMLEGLNDKLALTSLKPGKTLLKTNKVYMSNIELRPQAGAQERAMTSTADIVVYGGAAGS